MANYERLVVEKTLPGESHEYVIRDRKTWFPFFNVEGHAMAYNAGSKSFSIEGGRLLLTPRFAEELGRPGDAVLLLRDPHPHGNLPTDAGVPPEGP